MSTLQLLVALSGLAVTVVLSQWCPVPFGNPPSLPTTGTFLFASMHEQSYSHIFWCDSPLVQIRMHTSSFQSYPYLARFMHYMH